MKESQHFRQNEKVSIETVVLFVIQHFGSNIHGGYETQ